MSIESKIEENKEITKVELTQKLISPLLSIVIEYAKECYINIINIINIRNVDFLRYKLW